METGTMTAAEALAHPQGLDHHTNNGLDRPVAVPTQDQNHIVPALAHLSATHGRQQDLAINRKTCMLSRRTKRKILAGEYDDFDTILTEVPTNKAGSPWQ